MQGGGAPQAAPAFPERIGRYDVLLPIASGGMATVYLARSRGVGGFERDIALKLTHAHLRENAEFAAELIDEAKLAVRIRHPNVVPVLDVGEDPFGVFLVMEYIEGDTLSSLMRRARQSGEELPAAIAIRVLLDALAGLHAAHELADDTGEPLRIVHRDVSPQNVLVGVDGMSRLADFGIAKAVSRAGHTQSGIVKGKVAYMSPEQARAKPVDRRSDVWAAGAIAWEVFAGRRLYTSDDVSTLLAIVSEPPPLLRGVARDVSEQIEQVVAWALTIPLEQRCPSAQAFAKQLAAAARHSIGVAEHEEVAAFVKLMVGSKLAERRKRVVEVLGLRAQMGRIAATSTHDSALQTPSLNALGPRAAAEAAPASSVRSGESPGSIAGDPIVFDAPTATESVSVTTPGPIRGLQRRRRLWLWVGAATGLAVGGGAALGALLAARERPTPTSGAVTASPVEREGSSSAPAPPSEPPTSVTLASASAPPPASAEIEIEANASIASVKIGAREIRLDPPSRAARVPLLPDEVSRRVRLELTSSDGRRVVVFRDAGASSTNATFLGPAPKKKKLMGWEQ